MGDGDAPNVTRETDVRATPEEVWAALADPAELSAWFGGDARLDIRPGGTGRFRTDDGEVRLAVVEEVEAPTRLVFSWWPLQRPSGVGPGPHDHRRVTITIAPTDDGSRVHVDETVVAARATTGPGRGPGRGSLSLRPTMRVPARRPASHPGTGTQARHRTTSTVVGGLG